MSQGHVLLAHDLTPRSAPVTVAAYELAVALGYELSVVHVVRDKTLAEMRESAPEEGAYTDMVIAELQTQLRQLVDEQLEGRPAVIEDLKVIHGEAESALVSYLERTPTDYVVLGARSRSLVGKLLFGSVLQAVLLSGRCRTVTVPI